MWSSCIVMLKGIVQLLSINMIRARTIMAAANFYRLLFKP